MMEELKKYLVVAVILAIVIGGMIALRILLKDSEPIKLTYNQALVFIGVSFLFMVIVLKNVFNK